MAGELVVPPPAGVVGHHQNHPVLSPIGTATLILQVEVTPTQERASPTQEDIQDKTQQVTQSVAVLTSIPVEPILLVTQIRTLQVDSLPEGAILIRTQQEGIIQISIQLVEAIQTNSQAELVPTKEDILTSTLLQVDTPAREVTLLQVDTPAREVTLRQVDTQAREVILSTLLLGAIQIRGSLISTLQQVATQSEPEIQEQGGVSLAETPEVTQVAILGDTLVVRLVVTPTGTQIIKSSAPDLVEGATCPGWGALLSHSQYSPWDTSLNLQALPKKPWWRPAWEL